MQPIRPPQPSEIKFQAVHNRRGFEIVCEQIRDQIKAGKLRPGRKLPTEREMSRQFSVSRAVLREALRSLEMAGLISLKRGPGGGARVREGNSQTIARSIRDLILLGTISIDHLDEARVMLLQNVIELACRNATSRDLDALAANVDATERLSQDAYIEERIELMAAFYNILAAATKNTVFVILIDALTVIVRQVLWLAGPDITPSVVGSRRRVIAHLRERSAKRATAEMTRHLNELHAKWKGRLPDL